MRNFKIFVVLISMCMLCMSGCGDVKVSEKDDYTEKKEITISTPKPTEAPKMKELIIFEDCVALLKTDGSLWVWGDNYYGQLGLGATKDITTPTRLMNDVESMQFFGNMSAVIKADGTLLVCGEGLEFGSRTIYKSSNLLQVTDNVDKVKIDEKFMLILKRDGTLWGLGENKRIKIGESYLNMDSPVKLMDDVRDFSLSGFAIKNDDSVWYFGNDAEYEKIMDGAEQIYTFRHYDHVLKKDRSLYYLDEFSDCLVNKLTDNVKEVVDDGYFGAVIKQDGSLWDISTEEKIMDNVKTYIRNPLYYFVLKNDGTVWSWANASTNENVYGSLGTGQLSVNYTPVKILDNVRELYEENAIKNDGTLWSWGANYCGQLGNGTTNDSYSPIQIMEDVEEIYYGSGFKIAKKTDGTLWSWGYNEDGELGTGTTGNCLVPVKLGIQ